MKPIIAVLALMLSLGLGYVVVSMGSRIFRKALGPDTTKTTVLEDLALGILPGYPTVVPPSGTLRCTSEEFFKTGCVSPQGAALGKSLALSPRSLPVCSFVFLSKAMFPGNKMDSLKRHMKALCMTWGSKDTYIYTDNGLELPSHHYYEPCSANIANTMVTSYADMWDHIRSSTDKEYKHCEWFVNATVTTWINMRRLVYHIQQTASQDSSAYYLAPPIKPGYSNFAAFPRSVIVTKPQSSLTHVELPMYMVDPVGLRGGQETADGNACVPCYSVMDMVRPQEMIAIYRFVVRMEGQCTKTGEKDCKKVEVTKYMPK